MEEVDIEFEPLLEFLRDERGFDFTIYKRNSLSRRVLNRMGQIHIEGYAEYKDYLEVHPDEFELLFNTILINVTSFFRDESAWAYMKDVVIPDILNNREAGPIRAWSAGCASGEEVYSLALLLLEALGEETFQRRVKI